MNSLVPYLFILTAIVNISIGLYVVIQRPRGKPNQALFIFSLGAGLWVAGFGAMVLLSEERLAPFINVGCTLLLLGLFRLAQVFPTEQRWSQAANLFYVPFIFALVIAGWPGLLIQTVSFANGAVLPIQGSWYPYYALWFSGYTIATIVILFRSYRKSDSIGRERLQYFFVGTSLFILAIMVCDILLPTIGVFSLNFIGPITSVLSLTATAYAILRYRLMDIRVVIQRSIIYSVLLSLLIALYLFLLETTTFVFGDIIKTTAPVSAAVVIIIGLITIPHGERYFRKVTDRFFFKNSYVYSDALEELSATLSSNIQYVRLITQSINSLARILRPQYLYFYHRHSDSWFGKDGRTSKQSAESINKDDLRNLVIPVQSGKRVFGEFVLGPTLSGDSYSTQDHTLLRTFCGYAAVAIQKAELYQKLQEYTVGLEEKVSERTKHLQELQNTQREFFDDISHALQTPLTVLKSGLELISKDQPNPTPAHQNMARSIDDLSQLIRNMLELSRIGTPAAQAAFEVFDISQCVSRILEYVGTIVEQQGIELSVEIEPLLYVRGNSRQVEEVITNLLSNAVRYTEGCALRAIGVSLSGDSSGTTLTISDTGVGIPKDTIPHLFDRFYRAEGSQEKAKGFGLGLAIAKRIVTSHDGSIAIESVLGSGTTVIVRFPRP